jgi:hypothetical protein
MPSDRAHLQVLAQHSSCLIAGCPSTSKSQPLYFSFPPEMKLATRLVVIGSVALALALYLVSLALHGLNHGMGLDHSPLGPIHAQALLLLARQLLSRITSSSFHDWITRACHALTFFPCMRQSITSGSRFTRLSVLKGIQQGTSS